MPIEKDDFYPDFFDDANNNDDYDPSWYEPEDDPAPLTITERLSLALYAAARFLSRTWQRCPDCGRLELVAWRRVGEHEGCIPF